MTRRYTKDDVTYDVDKLSPEGISHFEVLVAAKRKVEEASLDLALARASVITLVSVFNVEAVTQCLSIKMALGFAFHVTIIIVIIMRKLIWKI